MAGWLRLLPIPGVGRRVEDWRWRWWPLREVGGGSCSSGLAGSFMRKRVDRCNGELLDEEAGSYFFFWPFSLAGLNIYISPKMFQNFYLIRSYLFN